MRYLPTQNTVRGLFAAEGYLELDLPLRALRELDRIQESGSLEPYRDYLRGQALHKLDRNQEAIEALQKAACTIPAPLNRKVWEDLSQCFRQEGLQELADIAELFAEDPSGGADRDLSESSVDEFLTSLDPDFSLGIEDDDPWNRSAIVPADDFDQYNFEENWGDLDREKIKPPKHKRPQK
jgi:tetratricopeptide (TPR) repeat protein